MLRATRTALTLAAICGTVAVLMPVAATAAGNGTLSSAEFRQLSAAMAQLNSSATSKSINWTKARAACHKIGGHTALLRAERASCLDSMRTLEALAGFPSEQTRCEGAATTTGTTSTGTTTTGTTTTPAKSTVIRVIICLRPRYYTLGHDANSLYRADVAERKQAMKRGFTGICLATLASAPADLRKEKLFASSAVKLAKDVTVLIKVTKGQLPSTDFNQVQIDSDVTRFESSAQAVLNESGPQRLAACAHQ